MLQLQIIALIQQREDRRVLPKMLFEFNNVAFKSNLDIYRLRKHACIVHALRVLYNTHYRPDLFSWLPFASA